LQQAIHGRGVAEKIQQALIAEDPEATQLSGLFDEGVGFVKKPCNKETLWS